MRILTTALLTLALALASFSPASAATTPTMKDVARAAARDYIAPLVRPDTKRVTVKVLRCRDLGRWHACRVLVLGVTRCSAVVRVRLNGQEYLAWVPSIHCTVPSS